jgi:hypothetical protein
MTPTSQEVVLSTSPARATVTALIDISVDDDLSESADVGGDTLCGLLLPTEFDTAAITFEVSVDDTNFYPLYNQDGAVTVAASEAVADRAISLDPGDFYGWRYIKVATDAAQTGTDTTITLVTRPL